MTEEQMKKYGIQYNLNDVPLNHTKSTKEHGVTIKVMTLEEQKKVEEEKERKKKEQKEKLEALEKANTVPCEDLSEMFNENTVLYASGNNVLFTLMFSMMVLY